MKENSEDKLIDVFNSFLQDKKVIGYRTKNDENYIRVNLKTQCVFGRIESKKIMDSLKRLFYEYDNKYINLNTEYLLELMRICCYDNQLSYNFVHRIYFDGNNYLYDLNQDDGVVVAINDKDLMIGITDEVYFKRGTDYKAQVEPDLECNGDELIKYVQKHFNIETDNESLLFTLYLVSCFVPNVNCPILTLFGEKGAGKSTFLRKVREIVSPCSADLTGMPRTIDDLALRLAGTYYTCIDNCSSIRRDFSDLLARSCTGGSVTKRKLYSDSDETLINIRSHVAINSVSMVTKESDLLDRSLILHLSRVNSGEIKTEESIWRSFRDDLPKILGSIFNILSIVIFDNEPIATTKLVRLADWHVLCLKIGRYLDISEDIVNEVIWNNQHTVNEITLDEDVISYTLISMIKKEKNYTASMSQLLKDLKAEARRLAISEQLFPKTPNHLSIKLKKVKSNLEQEYGIRYSVKNTGTCKKITIVNQKEQV